MSHHHSHNDTINKKNLLYATLLNLVISGAEFVGGVLSGSLALISDALHNLGDAFATLIAYIAALISGKKTNSKNTFGLIRVEIFAALINAVILIVISLYLFVEAYRRLQQPVEINSRIMLIVASIGLVANVLALFLLHKDSEKSINVRAAYLHLIGDSLSSVVVIIGGVLIMFFEIYWVDPVITFIIGIYILKETYSILKESVDILMQKTPPNVDIAMIKQEVEKVDGVKNMHHIHAWNLNDQKIYLDSHIDTLNDLPLSEVNTVRKRIEDLLKHQFGVDHITLQFEYKEDDDKDMINRKG